MALTAEEIADRFGLARDMGIGLQLCLYFLHHDVHFKMMSSELLEGGPLRWQFGRKSAPTAYDVTTPDKSVDRLRGDVHLNLEYMANVFQGLILTLGDRLHENAYFDKSPLLEFFRHIRNAMGHGNKFHFFHGEPRRPAAFNGLTITAADGGKQVFFSYIEPGDVLDLFEQVEAYLRRLP